MTLPSKTTSRRRGTSPIWASCIALSALLVAIACGGQRAESKTAAEPPQQPRSAPADASQEDRAYGQPVEAAPPAAEAAEGPSSTERERRYLDIDDIDALSRNLERTLRLSVPDCSTAASLRDRICDLAQRICDIATRSAEAEVAERCTDGRKRCERATESVRATCPD